ncbi:MAG: hypothetical protein L3K10_00420 [Thermoplasmata archaeon]|jgi:hypothetical protein|nr:hypothetical protein [Thermoplasmata archaeon]
MGAPAGQGRSREADEKTLEEVVPRRAVLTELARGFLLVHESNPDRARAFAKTFLQEREGSTLPARTENVNKVTLARLGLGKYPRGAVEPLPSRMPR